MSAMARTEGEDLHDPATALNCMEVFALGGTPGPELAPFAYERESLHRPIDRAAWLV